MGLFSSIGSIFSGVKDAVSAVSDFTGIGGGDLLSAGSALLGGIQTNNANAAQAAANRQFQADQTGTAYQRAVADLKAAGLNPMLAYTNGGAASGGGAQAVMQNAVGGAVNTALAARMNSAELKKLDADTQLSKDLSSKALAEWNVANANSAVGFAQADKLKAETLKVLQDIEGGKSDAEWSASHPWTVGVGRYIHTFSPFVDSAGSAAHSAAAVKNSLKSSPKFIGR